MFGHRSLFYSMFSYWKVYIETMFSECWKDSIAVLNFKLSPNTTNFRFILFLISWVEKLYCVNVNSLFKKLIKRYKSFAQPSTSTKPWADLKIPNIMCFINFPSFSVSWSLISTLCSYLTEFFLSVRFCYFCRTNLCVWFHAAFIVHRIQQWKVKRWSETY